jgi:hypothetical protein
MRVPPEVRPSRRANFLLQRNFARFQTDSKDFISALLPGSWLSSFSQFRGESHPGAIRSYKGRSKMKRWLSKGTVLAAIALPALSGAAWAGGSDDFGCSNATLKGEYAFGVAAYTPPGLPNGPPSVVTGIRVYDGNGHFTQRDYRGDSVPAQFSNPGQETGTYQVNPDCTGSDELDLNVPGSPPGTGVIKVLFVISDGGRHVHEVVSELIPPFSPGRVPTQTSADAWKVAAAQDD